MKRTLALLALSTILVTACAPGAGHPPRLPVAQRATKIGVGDVFEIRVLGEDKLAVAYTVAPDGSADLPYIHRIRVEGLEPQELAERIRTKLIADEILTNPSVSVSVKEYNSQRVEILGEVQKPGSIPMQPGMKLLRAIATAGGFTNLANKSHIVIRRRLPDGGTTSASVSVDEIIDNRIADPELQAGDSINIDQRIF